MPIALLIALAASLGIHAAALFGTDLDVATEPEAPPLVAELRPLPAPLPLPPPLTEAKRSPEPAPAVKANRPRRATVPAPAVDIAEAVAAPELPPAAPAQAPEVAAAVLPELEPEPEPAPAPATVAAAPEPRLPPRGHITYRVDRGDSNFEIGVARQEWEIGEGRYRLTSVIETTGLVRLFKPYRIEMESRGRMVENGLRPDAFVILRNGFATREHAHFDWDAMQVRVGERAPQPLAVGAQDLLSFNYELGFLTHGEAPRTLPIATGKKYGIYRLEVIGDEEIEVPAGVLRTLHLRAPGVNTTELWLAYDYLLLPVKIRHVDARGDSLVQVATAIELGEGDTDPAATAHSGDSRNPAK